MDGQPAASTGDMGQPRAQCDACGHDLDERESPYVYDCFHALHAACTYGSDDACPLPFCLAPRTRPAAPEVGAGGAGGGGGGGGASSPPDSSVAGQMRGDGPSAGPATECESCDVCGGTFRPSELYWKDECPHCMLSPPWSSSLGASFGSPSPPPPPHHPLQTSTFEYHHQQQQQPPAQARFAYAPPPAGSPSSCAACGGAVVRGQTAVTSQCNHTFHFRCFAGSVYSCPACGLQWRDVGPVSQPPPYRY